MRYIAILLSLFLLSGCAAPNNQRSQQIIPTSTPTTVLPTVIAKIATPTPVPTPTTASSTPVPGLGVSKQNLESQLFSLGAWNFSYGTKVSSFQAGQFRIYLHGPDNKLTKVIMLFPLDISGYWQVDDIRLVTRYITGNTSGLQHALNDLAQNNLANLPRGAANEGNVKILAELQDTTCGFFDSPCQQVVVTFTPR